MNQNEKIPISKCIIGLNLLDFEIEFLKSLTRIHGFKLIDFTEVKNINPLNNELYLITEFNQILVQELIDWCLEISVIGRTENEIIVNLKKAGIIRFWNLEKFALEEFPVFKNRNNPDQLILKPAILSSDSLFNRKINSLCKDFHLIPFITNNPVEFFFKIQTDEHSFLIIDWDISDSIIQNISNELKKLKSKSGRLPPIFGIKNFEEKNLFADLSQIREFCEILFSKNEILQLLVNSLPIQSANNKPRYPEKKINWNISQNMRLLSYTIDECLALETPEIEKQKSLYYGMF